MSTDGKADGRENVKPPTVFSNLSVAFLWVNGISSANPYVAGFSPAMSLLTRIFVGLCALLMAFGIVVAYLWYDSGLPWISSPPPALAGGDLRVVQGSALAGEDSILVAFERGRDRIDIKAPTMPFSAADISAIDVLVDELPAGVRGGLYWTSSESRRLQSAPLAEAARGSRLTDLSGHPGWKGQISDLGLVFLGRQGSFAVNGLRLVPLSWQAKLESYSQGLQTFETWSQRTINSLVFPATLKDLSPTFLAAAVVLIALLIAGALVLMLKKRAGFASLALGLFVAVWVILDVRWQAVFAENFVQASRSYAGSPSEAKSIMEADGQLLQFANTLKTNILPPEPQRVFIVHDSSGHNFLRLRLQYHLLPHNIYNYKKKLMPKSVKEGDYIILLEQIPGIRFSQSEKVLRSDKRAPIPAESVYRFPFASVYRVTAEPKFARSE